MANDPDSLPPDWLQKRLRIFPSGTRVAGQGEEARLRAGGCDLGELADAYGTPLYVYDQDTLDESLEGYRQALQQYDQAESGITYAGKAFLCQAMAQWVSSRGLWLDCSSAAELAIAQAAGLPPGQVVAHGVSKTQQDLEMARQLAGIIVVDNLDELERLAAWPPPQGEIWLRWRPEVEVATHTYTQTGQPGSKFGMGRDDLAAAVRRCQEDGLPLRGFHFHLGSNFSDIRPLVRAIEHGLDLLAGLQNETGWFPEVLSPGGGWGVQYDPDEPVLPPVSEYVSSLAQAVANTCRQLHLPLPRLQIEPGRSLVARAGIALYRIVATKQSGSRRWLLLDGGMADNPRPALYGARYTALPVSRPQRQPTGPVWLGGPTCESGDVLIEAALVPDLQPGELLAVPASGAYQLSMSSNYNGALRPAVLWLANGTAALIQRRETLEDFLRRDLPLR